MSAEIRIEVPDNERLTANKPLNRWETVRRAKALRYRARIHTLNHIRERGLTPLARVPFIVCAVAYPTARRADPHNEAPTVKHLVDGMVDAGLFPDDNSDIVPMMAFSRYSEKSKPHWYGYVFRFIDQEPNF